MSVANAPACRAQETSTGNVSSGRLHAFGAMRPRITSLNEPVRSPRSARIGRWRLCRGRSMRTHGRAQGDRAHTRGRHGTGPHTGPVARPQRPPPTHLWCLRVRARACFCGCECECVRVRSCVRASAAACSPRLCECRACFEPQDIGTAGGVRALSDYSSTARPGPTDVVAHQACRASPVRHGGRHGSRPSGTG